jgi:peptidoglycan hydrolase CwlO-like protein
MRKKILLIISGLFLVSTVILSIFASVSSSKLVDLERKITEVEVKNKEISEKLIKNSSLVEAANQAEGLGFVPTKTVVYLNHESEVAQIR